MATTVGLLQIPQSSIQPGAVSTVTPNTLGAAGTAGASLATPVSRAVQDNELSRDQLDQMLASNSPLMQRAASTGMNYAASRGLLNSSIAAGASQSAMIDAAAPFALQDARTFADAASQNSAFANQAALQNAQTQTNVNMFNVGEGNQNARLNQSAINDAYAFNAAASNNSIQSALDRDQQMALQENQQQFAAGENQAERGLRQSLQTQQFDFQTGENALDRALQGTLQGNQFDFQGTQADLDRQQQTDLQQSQQQFAENQAELDRAQQMTYLGAQQTFAAAQAELERMASIENREDVQRFDAWRQQNQNEWLAIQADLDRAFQSANIDQQSATMIATQTMDSIAAIYSDPNLTPEQKANAVANVKNLAVSLPDLLQKIEGGSTSGTSSTTSSSGSTYYGGASSGQIGTLPDGLNIDIGSEGNGALTRPE